MFISGFMKSSNECWQSREIQKALPPIMSVEQQPFVFSSVPGALVRRLLFLYPVGFYFFVFIFGWGSGVGHVISGRCCKLFCGNTVK